MLSEYCTFKNIKFLFLMNLKCKTYHTTRNNDLKLKKANNNQGKRSLLYTGMFLYNKYLEIRHPVCNSGV